jgi:hypothetical protein
VPPGEPWSPRRRTHDLLLNHKHPEEGADLADRNAVTDEAVISGTDLAPRNGRHPMTSHRFGVRIIYVTCVELWGFEPQTSCMPSAGSASTTVHRRRSTSWNVRSYPPPSGRLLYFPAVLTCPCPAILLASGRSAGKPVRDFRLTWRRRTLARYRPSVSLSISSYPDEHVNINFQSLFPVPVGRRLGATGSGAWSRFPSCCQVALVRVRRR